MGLIRFLLASAIVLCHTTSIEGYIPVSYNLGVQCFYIISGYYMSMTLTEKYTGKGSQYLFYTNRALKIYPVYWLNLILLILLNLFAFIYNYPGTFDFYLKYQHPSWWSYTYFVISNIIILGLDWAYLFGINKSGNLYFTKNVDLTNPNVYNYTFVGVAWTIGVELLFYVIAPWLNKRKWQILALVFSLSLAVRLISAFSFGDRLPWNYMFFPAQLMFFIVGMLSYKLIDVSKLKLSKQFKIVIYIVFLITILFYYQIFAESYIKQFALFACVVFCTPFSFDLTKNSKIDRFLGNLSYPIYITQELSMRFTAIKRFPIILDRGLTTLLLNIALSIIIYKAISVYVERIRVKRVKQFKHAHA